MKTHIVYDSQFGNTKKIAESIGSGINSEAVVQHVKDFDPESLQEGDRFILGSPTHGGRPTVAVQELLKKLAGNSLQDISVTAFDTRVPLEKVPGWLKFIMKIIGYAAPKMAKSLQKKVGKLICPSEGFHVDDKEGPVSSGELERAREWGEMVRQPFDQAQGDIAHHDN